MAADRIRFYLDENVSPVIAEQLRRKGIEVFTAQEMKALGDSDVTHLERATQMNCVLCTHDNDYLVLAAKGIEHSGIVYGRVTKHGISDWVKGLELIFVATSPEERQT